MKLTLTLDEAAEFSGIGKNTLIALTKKEETDFPFIKIGAKTLIYTDSLKEWLNIASKEHRQI